MQEPCHQVAVGLRRAYQDRFELETDDYFLMGMSIFDKILMEFKPTLHPNLRAHSFTLLKSRIIDKLRKDYKVAGHTQWSLLLRCTETDLRKALTHAGVVAPLLDEYLVAWDCYCAIYSSAKSKSKGKIQPPSDVHWEKMTAAFAEISSKSIQSEKIREYIDHCVEALYQYRSPKLVALNKVVGDEETLELLDTVEDHTEIERLEEAREWEVIQTQFQQIYDWLEQELATLDIQKYRFNPQIKEILELYYGKDLKQDAIVQKVNISQSAVSRNTNKLLEILSDRFIQWCPEHLGRSVKTDDLKSLSSAIEQWLQHYYQRNVSTL
jgi:RNA polymerase sigma factor (sigma-70 family)